jgi:delta24-sterol reductase
LNTLSADKTPHGGFEESNGRSDQQSKFFSTKNKKSFKRDPGSEKETVQPSSWISSAKGALKVPTMNQMTDFAEKTKKVMVVNLEEFVTEYRGIFVTIFLLPISFLADVYWYLYRLYALYGRRSGTPLAHAKRVKKVQEQIVKARQMGISKMCTARPAFMAMSFREGLYKSKWAKIDLNDFNHVLGVDVERKVVRCEPLCSMGMLTSTLIPKGWTLAVTPELDDLTVGGLIMGFGIETSSHKYGLFQHICKALEVVLPDGTFVRATPDENAEIFYALPWSHGTLGFLVAAEIQVFLETYA